MRIRKALIGDVKEIQKLVNCRRKRGITAFTEGWALYAAQLGADAGLEEDPYQEFGRLTYEIWRAVRLVVDSGVHARGWSRQQAISYMAENTGFKLGPATAEVDRHITEAGKGLAYTPGMLKIRELRQEPKRAWAGPSTCASSTMPCSGTARCRST